MEQNVVEVAAAFLVKDKTLFVAQRNADDEDPLKWELPGGTLKSGEKYDVALIREFKEEFGADIKVIQEVGSVEVDSADRILIVMFFLIETDYASIKKIQHNDMKYVSFADLKSLDLPDADRQFVELYEKEIKNFIS